MKIIGWMILLTLTSSAVQAATPYAGQEQRSIKALSEQDIEGYLKGRGMEFAKSAELNHYPGPRHVLDLAQELALTPEQRTGAEAIFTRMQQQASALGQLLVEKERVLDQEFSAQRIDQDLLRDLVYEIGALSAKIRFTHLQAHLEQRALLTERQVIRYDRLRGYDGGAQRHDQGHETPHHTGG